MAAGKNGLIEGMQRGQALFDLSTNSPTVIRRLHKLFADKGAHLLDSPVSGGPAGAASGKMALWVSGDEASYNKYRPVLDAMGDQIFYMGDDRRGLGRQAGAQSRGLHGQHGARRVLHHGGEGRRRSAAAVEGGAPGRQRPAAHLRHAGRALPAQPLRPGALCAEARPQGRVARHPARQGGRRADASRQSHARGDDRGAGPRLAGAQFALVDDPAAGAVRREGRGRSRRHPRRAARRQQQLPTAGGATRP